MKLLEKICNNHSGKVSDKWSIYLPEYEEKFYPYKDLPIKLLEIGIQNGGSLETYAKYFLNAKMILGCDIDRKCGKLSYSNHNIKVLIGDINDEKVRKEIINYSKFDIIIDDGSHQSPDIVKAFCNYFNELNDGGIFIFEDLHCSYWNDWIGGLFHPLSSINFFKKLVDVINYEHWGIERQRDWLLRLFLQNYKIKIENLPLEQIHSIEFANSLCFIKKKNSKENKLGNRIISGKDAIVEPRVKFLKNTPIPFQNQNNNPQSSRNLLPEEELLQCHEHIETLKKEIEVLKKK